MGNAAETNRGAFENKQTQIFLTTRDRLLCFAPEENQFYDAVDWLNLWLSKKAPQFQEKRKALEKMPIFC